MKATRSLVDQTPACNCRGAIDTGDIISTVHGTCGGEPAWWVACPDCGRNIGAAHRYPMGKAIRSLAKVTP